MAVHSVLIRFARSSYPSGRFCRRSIMAGRLLPFATPEEVVRVALAAYDAGRVVRVVGLTNRLLAISGALTPRFILRWLMAKMFAPTNAGAESSGPPKRRPQVS